MTPKRPVWKIADGLAWLAIAGWTCYASLGTNVFGGAPWPSGVVDYRLLYDYSRRIVDQKTYPPKHAYPRRPSFCITQRLNSRSPSRLPCTWR